MKKIHFALLALLFCFVFPVHAQNWTDNFNDGNFTGGLKVWSGVDVLWQVDNAMLRSNGLSVSADTIYMSTSSTHALDAQWEFYIRLAFNPSSNNFADIYLISDSSDVTHPNNAGYYIRMGSTNDDIKLWYRNGMSAPVLIIDGADSLLNFTDNTFKVRVTRTASGLWRILADATGTGNGYALVGTATENSLVTSSWFGVVARHSSTNRTNFYFDDVEVISPIPADNTPPTVTGVMVSGTQQLQINFSESLDPASATTAANYFVSGNLVSQVSQPASNQVLVTFQNNFPPSVLQSVTVSGVQDLAGNTMVSSSHSFQRGDMPAYMDVVINELIGDVSPVVGLPEVEWIELYNRSSKAFNLKDWSIISQTNPTTSPTILKLPSFTLLPDSFVVICTVSGRDSFSSFNIPVIDAATFSTNFLTTTGKYLTLTDSVGALLDTVNYLNAWYKNTTKANGGWTLEKINPSDTCATPFDNWVASIDPVGGTPGRQNSVYSTTTVPLPPSISSVTITSDTTVQVCFHVRMDVNSILSTINYSVNQNMSIQDIRLVSSAAQCVEIEFNNFILFDTLYTIQMNGVQNCYQSGGVNLSGNFIRNAPPRRHEIIINEIFADPSPQIGLPATEFIEIWNRSNRALNLQGWKLSEGSSTLTPFTSYVLLPDSFLIVTQTPNFWDYAPYGQVMTMNSFSLTNAGEPLTLSDSSGNVIDFVHYSDTWYNDAIKKNGGWTLERIDRNDTCSTGKNWSASQATIGGTPGSMNSINGTLTDNTGPILLSAVPDGMASVIACFDEPLSLAFAGISTNYSIVNNALNIMSVEPQGPDFTCVKINFDAPLTVGQVYELVLNQLTDCKGNLIDANASIRFLLNPVIQASDIVINEIFADPTPSVGLPGFQFVELYNRSTQFYDLAGMTFNTRTLTSSIIGPGEYVILVNATNASAYDTLGQTLGVASLSSFTQSGATLTLRDANDEVINEVSYTRDWYKDGSKEDGGWTLERINPDDTCATFSNWIASIDSTGGTPGRRNSVEDFTPDVTGPQILEITTLGLDTVLVFLNETTDGIQAGNPALYEVVELVTGNLVPVISAQALSPDYAQIKLTLGTTLGLARSYELRISQLVDCKGNISVISDTFVVGDIASPLDVIMNEIYTDFTPLVGLPAIKYLEIYNRAEKPFDMTGWSIRRYDASGAFTSTYIFDSPRVLLPGQYLLIVPSSGVSAYESFATNIMGAGSLTFNITSDRVALVDAEGVVLDRVAYNDTWYRDATKKSGGWSLERIDYQFTCDNALNWIASNDVSGGTPGRENSVKNAFIDVTPPQISNAYILGLDTIVLKFNETLDFTSLTASDAFTINNGVGVPAAVLLPNITAGDLSLVYLVSPISLDSNRMYEVQIKGIKDCPGNQITTDVIARVAIPVTPSTKDVLLNEILFHPYTRRTRFVEIINHSDKILDVSLLYLAEGIENSDSLSSVRRISDTPKLLLPGSILCVTPSIQDQLDIYQPIPDAQFQQISSIPSYNSTEDEVVLFYGIGIGSTAGPSTPLTIMDRFKYKDDYHFSDLLSKQGVSLERINLDPDTQNPDLWHSAASTVNYATPGYKNSQQLNPQAVGEVSVNPETFSPDGDGIDDVLAINYQFTRFSMNARVTVYDAVGNLVKIVRNNFLLETESGFVTWDGSNDNGQKAPIGVYVVVFEAIHQPTGEKFVYKVPCVLAARLN